MEWIPKCRRQVLFGQIRVYLGKVLHELARQRESRILEGHLHPDHMHMLISIPQNYAESQVIGYQKGKSAIHISRTYLGQRRNYTLECISGHEGILYRRWEPTKR